MTKKTTLIMTAALLLLGAAYVFMPDGSVYFDSFEPRFTNAVSAAGFQTVVQASCNNDEVRLPRSIRWHPRHWFKSSSLAVASGFPDSTMHYELRTTGSPPLDCFVRYLGRRAMLINIRTRTAQESAAQTLRAALAREFPWLTITATTP